MLMRYYYRLYPIKWMKGESLWVDQLVYDKRPTEPQTLENHLQLKD
jgi:hypothetical protein